MSRIKKLLSVPFSCTLAPSAPWLLPSFSVFTHTLAAFCCAVDLFLLWPCLPHLFSFFLSFTLLCLDIPSFSLFALLFQTFTIFLYLPLPSQLPEAAAGSAWYWPGIGSCVSDFWSWLGWAQTSWGWRRCFVPTWLQRGAVPLNCSQWTPSAGISMFEYEYVCVDMVIWVYGYKKLSGSGSVCNIFLRTLRRWFTGFWPNV